MILVHETHVIANNSTNNIVVFFFVSDLKIVYWKKLSILDQNALDKLEKYFVSLFNWRQNNSKQSPNRYNALI